MTKHSIGLNLAWQIAAAEAGSAGQPSIEKEHILIGICSFEKMLASDNDVVSDQAARAALQAEYEAVEVVLRALDVDSTSLRRQVRRKLGKSDHKYVETIVHRSQACKLVFERAEVLAASEREATCLHFLAALQENP